MRLPSYFSGTATCPSCGAEVKARGFCTECGASMEAPGAAAAPACKSCGGDGSGLAAGRVFCAGCRWLRPLSAEYRLPVESFIWKFDADAMKVLQGMGPLTSAAQGISKKVGRPWLEASIGGVRLSERQLPWIFEQAVRAARIMALPRMPEIYVSGDQGWEALTLGSEHSSFIVLGSMLTRLRRPDLLFVLGREMGHCRAGHALWRTIAQLASGHLQKRQPLFSEGLLQFLHPSRLLETAIDAPLMAWSRQATITADRAGLLVSGNIEMARRVFLTLSLRLLPLFEQIDMDAWLEQEQEAFDMTSQVSEWTNASAPYLNRRLGLAREFMASEAFQTWRAAIEAALPPEPDPARQAANAAVAGGGGGSSRLAGSAGADVLRFPCQACGKPVKMERAAFGARTSAKIRCPFCSTVSPVTIQ